VAWRNGISTGGIPGPVSGCTAALAQRVLLRRFAAWRSSSANEALSRLCSDYIDCVKAYTQKEQVRSTFTGPSEERGEGITREIERRIAVGSAGAAQQAGIRMTGWDQPADT